MTPRCPVEWSDRGATGLRSAVRTSWLGSRRTCPHAGSMTSTTSVPTAAIEQAAARLLSATGTGTPCPPVRDLIGSTDVAAAYAVQEQVTAARTAAGARVVGHKIGLTSTAVQAATGRRPARLRAALRRHGLRRRRRGADRTRLLQPKVEAEIAFVLADGPGRRGARRRRKCAARSPTPSRRWRSSTAGSRTGTSPSATPWPTTRPAGLYVLGDRAGPARGLRAGRRRDADEHRRRGRLQRQRRRLPRRPARGARRGWPGPLARSAPRCAPARSCSPERSVRCGPCWPDNRSAPTSPASGRSPPASAERTTHDRQDQGRRSSAPATSAPT